MVDRQNKSFIFPFFLSISDIISRYWHFFSTDSRHGLNNIFLHNIPGSHYYSAIIHIQYNYFLFLVLRSIYPELDILLKLSCGKQSMNLFLFLLLRTVMFFESEDCCFHQSWKIPSHYLFKYYFFPFLFSPSGASVRCMLYLLISLSFSFIFSFCHSVNLTDNLLRSVHLFFFQTFLNFSLSHWVVLFCSVLF